MCKFVKYILFFVVICFSFNSFSQNRGNVYFKIQIAASKTPLSNSKLEYICKTKDILIVEYDNNWYKYVLRKKFFSYNEAFEYKKALCVRGSFILAYKNEQKVNITEVVDSNENNIENTNKIVYRLELGVSVKKANKEAMGMINSGEKPIIIVKHKKYYSYTIGDFLSEDEAKKFKEQKQLIDAKVVKFKNGKPFLKE